jgi:hypothetical protein
MHSAPGQWYRQATSYTQLRRLATADASCLDCKRRNVVSAPEKV